MGLSWSCLDGQRLAAGCTAGCIDLHRSAPLAAKPTAQLQVQLRGRTALQLFAKLNFCVIVLRPLRQTASFSWLNSWPRSVAASSACGSESSCRGQTEDCGLF